jgi:N-acetylmuramate 1-kinase
MVLSDASDSRLALATHWVAEDLGFEGATLEPASADASFRRYFRLTRDDESYIVMDAPPDKEDVAPFVAVARMLKSAGLNVPVVLARDARRGLLLLSDLGTRQYLDELALERQVDRLYTDAMGALLRMQARCATSENDLAPYDHHLLMREMELMPEWFLGRHLGLRVGSDERAMLDRLFAALVQSAAEQPRAFVHRDYHSRNLLLSETDNPGILDFQDAVHGPVTYDLVSLLKDCYIAWPQERVNAWAAGYRQRLLREGRPAGADEAQFLRWFDLMGLQRHIKVLGIFARLYYRDGKAGYLKDLPRVLEYTRSAAARHPQTREFADYLTRVVDAEFGAAQRRAGAA